MQQLRQVRGARKELQMVRTFVAQGLGADEKTILGQGGADFFQDRFGIVHGEMTDRAIPNHDIVLPARERIGGRVRKIVSHICPLVVSFRNANCGRVDINRIDLRALWPEEMFCEEAVAASNVENDIAGAKHFRRVEGTKKLIRMHSVGAEAEQEPGQAVIGEVRASLVELPETFEQAFVMASQQPGEKLLPNSVAPKQPFFPSPKRQEQMSWLVSCHERWGWIRELSGALFSCLTS